MISNNFNDEKFKNIVKSRNDWIKNGNENYLSSDNNVNDLANNSFNSRIVLKIRAIEYSSNNIKTLSLVSDEDGALPMFKAGQKIALTLRVDNKFITRPYHLVSTPTMATEGEYRVIISNDGDPLNNYLFNYANVNDIIVSSEPFGNFYYDSIRDNKNIIAIVDNTGIAPLFSMGESIVSGDIDINLTIFYSAKRFDDFIYYNELFDLDKRTSRVKVIYVLSEELKDDCLIGFVSLDKIKPYYNDECSIFISGNEGLLKYLDKELDELQLPKKSIRYEAFMPRCNVKKTQEYNLSIYIDDVKYETKCYNNKTIMSAIEDSGMYIPSKCHNGSCGFCKSELVKGKVKVINDKRDIALKQYNYIHPCVTYPMSDIEIIVR